MFGNNGYFTESFSDFWARRYREVQQSPIVISGIGFDPRSILAAKILFDLGLKPKVFPINFSVSATGGSDTDANLDEATENNTILLEKFEVITPPIKVNMFDSHDRPIGGREVVNKTYELKHLFHDEVDVIIDIGGLPRSLFGPLISFFLNQQNTLGYKNLHIASLPDEQLDSQIKSDQILAPKFMYGFKDYQSDDKLVWIPIIGKSDTARLRQIHNKIEKNCIEICPVLPFKPNNPRQVDKLLLDLYDVLFNEIRTIYNNIIYIDNSSPFLVYREIVALSDYYSKLLGDLSEDVKVLVTPLDNKTSCVGAILAASLRGLPVMYADTVSYQVNHSDCLLRNISSEPLEIWVAGEAYDN